MFPVIILFLLNMFIINCSGYENMGGNSYLYRYLRQERQKQPENKVSLFIYLFIIDILGGDLLLN